MPYVTLSKGRVHYSESGQGVPLVLLHANPGDSRDFEAIVPSLAQSHRVLALDWPGYGLSDPLADPGAASVADFREALRAFIAALSLPPAVFIGNSIGANVAARLAIESPQQVRGLVLVSPGGFTPHNTATRLFCRLQGGRFSIPPRLFARLYLKHRTPPVRSMLERAATLQATPDRLALNRAMWRSFAHAETDLRPSAARIDAPTALFFGQHDPVIPAHRDGRVAAHCMPFAQYAVLPCGHAPFAELPDVFLARVQRFLAANGLT